MTKKYYAHRLPGEPQDKWQPLEEHMKYVLENLVNLLKNLAIKYCVFQRSIFYGRTLRSFG